MFAAINVGDANFFFQKCFGHVQILAGNDFIYNKGCHMLWVCTLAKTSVIAQFYGQLVVNAGAADADYELLSQPLGLQQFNELCKVVYVHVFLGDDLAY